MLDTETSGLKCGYHEINQISVLRVSDKFQKTFNIAVENPGRASAQALQIQGITKADLRSGVPISEAVEEITKFIKEDGLNEASRCIVGHNVSFDRRFCHAAWEVQKTKFPADLWLCTKKFYKNYVKKVGQDKVMALQAEVQPGETKVKYGQDLCLAGAGLKPKVGAHSATVDTQNCMTLWDFLMNENLNHVRVIEPHPHTPKTIEPEFYDF